MNFVYNREQKQATERYSIETLGIPSRILMENAGKACADWMLHANERIYASGYLIICGKGNNGGDGLVMARYLALADQDVTIVRLGSGKASPDNAVNYEICKRLEIDEWEIRNADDLEEIEELSGQGICVIDALYGTGFKGKLIGLEAELIRTVNRGEFARVAIDIPSGIDANTGVTEFCFDADLTFVLQNPVWGNCIGNGSGYNGTLIVLDIGIMWQEQKTVCGLMINDLVAKYPSRYRASHKGDYGSVVICAGSPGMTGAAVLAASAALRAGAGYVRLFHAPGAEGGYAQLPPEIMARPLSLVKKPVGIREFEYAESGCNAILVGPGIGTGEDARALVDHMINTAVSDLILDADALNILAENPQWLERLADRTCILTPHWGEFCRLAGISMESLAKDPVGCLTAFTQKHNVEVLLKSHYSMVCTEDLIFLNTTGNDGLATGGSGDVLSGIIASFMAQGLEPDIAAASGSYLLGKTAEKLAEKRKSASITPSDIIQNLFNEE